MSFLNPFAILPEVAMVVLISAGFFFKKVDYPSPLAWGRMLWKIGPLRVDDVLAYNEKVATEESGSWRTRREARRRNFSVNWGYLSVQTRNTTAFLQALRFEQLKIKANKSGLKYGRVEVAIVTLMGEAQELRWQQVRRQIVLQLRMRLGLKVDKEVFNRLMARYKSLERGMTALAQAEGEWLYGMLVERLGLGEWQVVDGGLGDPDTA